MSSIPINATELKRFRASLVDELTAQGHITSPAVRDAFTRVPRHEFVPSFFRHLDGKWEPFTPSTDSAEEWIAAVYSNDAWVTQLDGHLTPEQATGPVEGEPTSSSSMPDLMADMLELLELEPGARVLEIGTGTGYNAALLAAIVGGEQVTSVEVDSEVSKAAAVRLFNLGYSPRLVVGDGQVGYKVAAPYDRIIATCSVRTVPRAWIEQTQPGGLILATLATSYLMGQVLLVVGEDGSAEGGFVIPGSSFMPTRRPDRGPVWIPNAEAITAADRRATAWGPERLWSSWPEGFLAGWVLGDTLHYLPWKGEPTRIVDHTTNSWAAFFEENGATLVAEGGPRRIWSDVEAILNAWRETSDEGLESFRLRIGPEGSHILDLTGTGLSWSLTEVRG